MSVKNIALFGWSAAIALMLSTAPAVSAKSQEAERDRTAAAKAQDDTAKSANEVEDAWILTKVKAKFIGEDALKDSDIDIDVTHGVVILKGTVASEAGRARAVAIAKDTDGVARVDDRLAIGMATHKDHEDAAVGTTGRKSDARDEARDAAHDTKHAAKDAADDVKHSTKHAAKNAKEESKDTAGTAGEAISDGWITTKVKSSFVGVDALDGSDIDVDTNDHVVTLSGTVRSAVARAEAVRLAKAVKGVSRVNDKLVISDKDGK